MKIKIFDTRKNDVEEKINKFLEEKDVLSDRVIVRKDEIIYSYFDKDDRTYGMSKDSALETMGCSLEKLQAQLLEALEAKNFFDFQVDFKNGSKEKQDIAVDQLRMHKKRVEESKMHIAIVRDMIKRLKDGSLELG